MDNGSEHRPNVPGEQLRQHIERIERIEEEVKALNSDKSEFYRAAKAEGYDPAIIKKVVALRRQDPHKVAEEQALTELYLDALGSALPITTGPPIR